MLGQIHSITTCGSQTHTELPVCDLEFGKWWDQIPQNIKMTKFGVNTFSLGGCFTLVWIMGVAVVEKQ